VNADDSSLWAFLAPQAEAYAFVNLLCGVFLVGLAVAFVGAFRFKRALAESIEVFRRDEGGCASDEPSAFLRLRARPDATLGWIDAVPSVLVTIGILGTFMGIGLAVQKSLPLLDEHSRVPVAHALSELLGAIRFKFQTSGWGIVLSLLFTGVRVGLEGWMNRQVEHEALRLTHFRCRPEQRIASAIDQSFKRLEVMLGGNVAELNAAARALRDGSAGLTTTVGQLQSHVQVLSSTVDRSASVLSTASANLGGVGEKIERALSKVSTEIGSKLKESNKGLEDSASRQIATLKGGLDELRNALGTSLSNVEKTLNEKLASFERSSTGAAKQQVEAAERSQKSIESTLTTMSTKLDGAIQKQAEAVDRTGKATQQALDGLKKELQASLGSLNQHQAHASTSLAGLDTSMQHFERHLKTLLDLMSQVKGDAAAQRVKSAVPRAAGAGSSPQGRAGQPGVESPDDFL